MESTSLLPIGSPAVRMPIIFLGLPSLRSHRAPFQDAKSLKVVQVQLGLFFASISPFFLLKVTFEKHSQNTPILGKTAFGQKILLVQLSDIIFYDDYYLNKKRIKCPNYDISPPT